MNWLTVASLVSWIVWPALLVTVPWTKFTSALIRIVPLLTMLWRE